LAQTAALSSADYGFTDHPHRPRPREGVGVLLVSSESDDILTLSDRILVMFDGRIVAEFRRREVTERKLGLNMGGA